MAILFHAASMAKYSLSEESDDSDVLPMCSQGRILTKELDGDFNYLFSDADFDEEGLKENPSKWSEMQA